MKRLRRLRILADPARPVGSQGLAGVKSTARRYQLKLQLLSAGAAAAPAFFQACKNSWLLQRGAKQLTLMPPKMRLGKMPSECAAPRRSALQAPSLNSRVM